MHPNVQGDHLEGLAAHLNVQGCTPQVQGSVCQITFLSGRDLPRTCRCRAASGAPAGSQLGPTVSGSRCPTASTRVLVRRSGGERTEREPRDPQRGPGLAGQRLGEHAVLDRDLEPDARGAPAPRRGRRSSAGARAVPARAGRRRDRVLDCEVDSAAADRRHCMGRVADAQHARRAPALEPVDHPGEQLDVVPAGQQFDPVTQNGASSTSDSRSAGSLRCASRFHPLFSIT
jgi:hypothetical protein